MNVPSHSQLDASAFALPKGLHGRFGIVKLWPNTKAAEDENIVRFKLAARSLGLQCVEIDAEGKLLESPFGYANDDNVDFVIHLHFDTPKLYDAFSFVALWNPLHFYHEWGYRRCAENLLTHDDFLSCASPWADDQVLRLISRDHRRIAPKFFMFHSLSEPILPPTLGEQKLFYVGINWERLGKNKSRHQDLLNMLEAAGQLRIYGPDVFNGVRVWEGHKGYVGPLPFDGVSVIHAIHKCGITLALSSEAHKQSELMSNRLFEGLAAGSIIICDENPFAKRHFGDNLLYIDTTLPIDDVYSQIKTHLRWINENPDLALALAERAQSIFKQRYKLDSTLRDLYENFPARRDELGSLYTPREQVAEIALILMMRDFDTEKLHNFAETVRRQKYRHIRPILLIDPQCEEEHHSRIEAIIAGTGVDIEVLSISFGSRLTDGKIVRARLLGAVLSDALQKLPASVAAFTIITPQERIFSTHLSSLVRELEANPQALCAYSFVVYSRTDGDNKRFDLWREPDWLSTLQCHAPGFGRFLFRRGVLNTALFKSLPYVHRGACALIAASAGECASTKRASLVTSIWPSEEPTADSEIIIDLCGDDLKAQLPSLQGVYNFRDEILSEIARKYRRRKLKTNRLRQFVRRIPLYQKYRKFLRERLASREPRSSS